MPLLTIALTVLAPVKVLGDNHSRGDEQDEPSPALV